jgi:hemoglobin-like flavoprotein
MDETLRDQVASARASFDRSTANSDFFTAFYRRLFELRPEVKPLFAKTDFEKQHRLLRHAIGLLLSFPGQPETEPTILSRIAERHSHRDLKIEPAHYPAFLESLIDTVRRCDPQVSPEIEAAWRGVLAKGFAYMQARF